MPFISAKTNQAISAGQEETLRKELGKAISLLPGKSETWLMISLEGDLHMAFQGTCDPCAMLQVTVYGKANPAAYEKLTEKLTNVVSEVLSVPPDRIYVAYGETENWGWNGSNF